MPTTTEILVDLLRKSRAKTLEILHHIPADVLDETHPPVGKRFGDTIQHISHSMDGWLQKGFRDDVDYQPTKLEPPYDKLALAQDLERSLQRMLDFVTADEARLYQPLAGASQFLVMDRIVYLIGHEVNHQTQILLGLQANGHDWDIFLPF